MTKTLPTTRQIANAHNLAIMNRNVKGCVVLEPTTVFDEAYQRPISEWYEAKKKKTAIFIVELAWVFKRGFNEMFNFNLN